MTSESDDLSWLDAAALNGLLASGATSSAEIVDLSLRRIERVDQATDGVRAVLEVNPEAAAEAELLDRERAVGDLRGPLHGLPVLVKDNIDTAAPLHTTAGSWALHGTSPAADAPLVRRLRAAGMVVLGKANLSEWANYRSTRSTSGWSAVGGLTRNPWRLTHTACGSSSGSAAGIAVGLAPLSIGTETDGSIVCPASVCGVVGLKPTVGLVPSAGVVPISHSQDSVGPMARTVRDAAVLLAVLTGRSPDAYLAPPGTPASGLRGVRLGVPRPGIWTRSPAVAAAVEAALEVLAAAGATIVDEVAVPSLASIDPADELTVLDHELKAGLAAYFATRPPGGPRTLAELIANNREHADLELVHFDQDIFERSELTTGLDDPAYLQARQRCVDASRARGIDAVLAAHRLDALVLPSSGPAWPIDLVHGDDGPVQDRAAQDVDEHGFGSSTLPALAGYPIVTVPCGLGDGLPVGVSFTGTAGSEAVLLRIADAYERSAFGPDGATAALGPPPPLSSQLLDGGWLGTLGTNRQPPIARGGG